MLLHVHPQNPEPRKINKLVTLLESGGIIAYPTDTVYAIGCSINQTKAIQRICQLRQIDPRKANLTMICSDISQISKYTRQLSKEVFKVIKRNTPGPFTFVLNSNSEIPKLFQNRKKSFGVRIPDHTIVQSILDELGVPLLSISLKNLPDEEFEYFINAEEIDDTYGTQIDLVVEGGLIHNEPSTIVDCTDSSIEITRQSSFELLF